MADEGAEVGGVAGEFTVGGLCVGVSEHVSDFGREAEADECGGEGFFREVLVDNRLAGLCGDFGG